MSDLDRYNLSTEELAAKIGYHPQYVRDLARLGKIPALKRGRAWRFCEAEVLSSDLFTKSGDKNAQSGDNILG